MPISIIRRSCREYTDQANKLYDVTFDMNEPVYQEIYENAVYPTQGTRPVFTSIHKLFGSPLSDAIFWAKARGVNRLKVGLDIPGGALVFSHGGDSCNVKIDLDIRARRARYSDDYNALVAVHEAGHAILYAELFKAPPVEVAISVASFKGGYNRFKHEHLSKQEMVNRIVVGMGGIVAEEIVFGQELRSTGCASDIEKATELAALYVRSYAMDGFSSHIATEMTGEINSNTDVRAANPVIDQLIKDQKAVAQSILTKHRDLLILLSKRLIEVKKMDAAEFVAFVSPVLKDLKPLTDKDVNGDYAARLLKA